MPTTETPILDERGSVMFHCGACGGAISIDDFVQLGLRLPDRGESADDCRDAELLDRIDHVDCSRAARAG
jgi:hypothetical protein